MITVRETTVNDLANVKQLWADGDVMPSWSLCQFLWIIEGVLLQIFDPDSEEVVFDRGNFS